MTDDAEWVLLVECYTMAELHTLRATLEARGVPCRVQGEHMHGVLGGLQSAAARSRVLVPRRALAVARTLAEDIVGPFDERPEPEDDTADASPFRTAAEDDDEDELEPSDDAEPAHARSPADADEDESTARPKTYLALGAVLVLMLASVPLAGLAHLYVHRNVRGGILLVVSLFSLAATFGGASWASLLLQGLWIVDFAGGAHGIAAYNRRLRSLPPAPTPALPEA